MSRRHTRIGAGRVICFWPLKRDGNSAAQRRYYTNTKLSRQELDGGWWLVWHRQASLVTNCAMKSGRRGRIWWARPSLCQKFRVVMSEGSVGFWKRGGHQKISRPDISRFLHKEELVLSALLNQSLTCRTSLVGVKAVSFHRACLCGWSTCHGDSFTRSSQARIVGMMLSCSEPEA